MINQNEKSYRAKMSAIDCGELHKGFYNDENPEIALKEICVKNFPKLLEAGDFAMISAYQLLIG